jgi:dipeptidyl aminopeptidase/acylaminoacyl peptidase
MIVLNLKRIYKGSTYTIGHLYINNKYFCDTLEDIDRGLH